MRNDSVSFVYAPVLNGKRVDDGRDIQIHSKAVAPGAPSRDGCGDAGVSEAVAVAGGHQGALCDLGAGGTELHVTIGGTYIHVLGYTRQQMLAVAAALRKLN